MDPSSPRSPAGRNIRRSLGARGGVACIVAMAAVWLLLDWIEFRVPGDEILEKRSAPFPDAAPPPDADPAAPPPDAPPDAPSRSSPSSRCPPRTKPPAGHEVGGRACMRLACTEDSKT